MVFVVCACVRVPTASAQIVVFMSESLNIALLEPFDGNVNALRREWVYSRACLPVPFVRCNGDRRLYAASLPDTIIGGKKGCTEQLFIQLLTVEPDFYPQETHMRDTFVPSRFFWLAETGILRQASLYPSQHEMLSLALSGYPQSGLMKHIKIHRILAWTFLCPPRLFTSRWDRLVSCEHRDSDHGNNNLANLELWDQRGPDGHGAASARKRRRVVT